MRVHAVIETCLYVEDLEAAGEFYTRVLGLEVMAREPGRHLFFRCGPGVLLLFNAERTSAELTEVGGVQIPLHGARGPGHVAFAVPEQDVPAWRKRVEELGIPVEAEVKWPRGGRSLYVRDPAGNSVELVTPGTWGTAPGAPGIRQPVTLAILGGAPVRAAFPEPPPRLSRAEAAPLRQVLAAPDWSRAGDDWPLPCLDRLEERWAQAHGAPHAVAVASGTAALTLILRALGLEVGDEILIPAYGCPAVDVAVLAAGLTPIHVDLDPQTYGMAPAAAAAAVTPRTAALIAVHFGGAPAALASLRRVAERHGLAVVEDACLAPGARYEGKPVGTWGQAAAFSLGVCKPISAGEGGLITTRDPTLADALRRARSLGADPSTGDLAEPSGNYRLTSLQAAVALPQLARLEADLERRAAAAATLASALEESPWFQPHRPARGTPSEGMGSMGSTGPIRTAHTPHTPHTPHTSPTLPNRSTWSQFWIRYDEEAAGVPRERVVRALQAEGIPLFEGWSRPNYCLAVYTPSRAAAWLPARGSDRAPDHYERTHCPQAERAAFREALLVDFPLLNADSTVIQDAAAALAKVSAHLPDLR